METKHKRMLRFFSALADETRLKIVMGLADKPQTVNSIHQHLNTITLSAVSHQLRHLSDLDIVVYEKNGREKQYRLSDKFCWCMLKDAIAHGNGIHCKACAKVKRGNKYS